GGPPVDGADGRGPLRPAGGGGGRGRLPGQRAGGLPPWGGRGRGRGPHPDAVAEGGVGGGRRSPHPDLSARRGKREPVRGARGRAPGGTPPRRRSRRAVPPTRGS